jgi:hypothetical protein
VVTARLQFTCWSQRLDPNNYAAIHNPSGAAWIDCLAVAKEVMTAPSADNPVPGATHYYSPKTQAALHRLNPGAYDEKPDWAYPPAIQVPNPVDVPVNAFQFYKHV